MCNNHPLSRKVHIEKVTEYYFDLALKTVETGVDTFQNYRIKKGDFILMKEVTEHLMFLTVPTGREVLVSVIEVIYPHQDNGLESGWIKVKYAFPE